MKKLKIISLMFFTISILIGSFAFADTQGFLPNSNTSANNDTFLRYKYIKRTRMVLLLHLLLPQQA